MWLTDIKEKEKRCRHWLKTQYWDETLEPFYINKVEHQFTLDAQDFTTETGRTKNNIKQSKNPNDSSKNGQNQKICHLSILRSESDCFGIFAPFILARASANILCCSANASSSVISTPLHLTPLGESCWGQFHKEIEHLSSTNPRAYLDVHQIVSSLKNFRRMYHTHEVVQKLKRRLR